MNTLSPPQTILPWWVEVFTSVSQQTYHLGPFKSRAEAKLFRGTHVEVLLQQETRDIIALIIDANPEICLQVEDIHDPPHWRSVIVNGRADRLVTARRHWRGCP